MGTGVLIPFLISFLISPQFPSRSCVFLLLLLLLLLLPIRCLEIHATEAEK